MTKQERKIKKQNGLKYVNAHTDEISTKNHIKERFNKMSNKKIGRLTFSKNDRDYVLIWSKPSNSMRIETAGSEIVKELNQVNIGNALEYINNNL